MPGAVTRLPENYTPLTIHKKMNLLEPCYVNPYSMKSSLLLITLVVAFLVGTAAIAVSEPVRRDHVEVELVSDRITVRPGDTITVGLHMRLDHEWHLYWTNPGDAGLAPRIKWNLPEGSVALPPQFPVPKRIPAGPLVSFGYDGELLLLTDIILPGNRQFDEPFAISAEVDWLVCKVECIPGEAVLSTSLPVTDSDPVYDSSWVVRFGEARLKQPASDSNWDVAAGESRSQLKIKLSSNPTSANTTPDEVFFFPDKKGIIENATPQQLSKTAEGFEVLITKNPLSTDTLTEISGMLVSTKPWVDGNTRLGLRFSAPVEPMAEPQPLAFAATDITWWQAILFAFAGGIILNLMPCVLPVLSIKVLGFVQQAGEGQRRILKHNFAFAFGVILSFWILAVGLLLLRAGGEQLGWGFQLQSPTFIIILTSFMFLMALNLLGVFEVGASLTGIGSGTKRSGLTGSFIAGVTATVVATPCTAPFMGSALGFSLTQPAWISLAIFTSLGLGMAAPYVVLTSSPWLLRFVPKPGRWMETLKHAMGFLLLATVVWLIWVLSIQAGTDSILLLLGTLLCLAVSAWILGRWGGYAIDQGKRFVAYALALALAISSVTLAASYIVPVGPSLTSESVNNGLAWEQYSPERVVELHGQGRPLLIDFTAAWCLSCKVNERVAFGSVDVQGRLNELSVVTMKADWTSRDERITRALASFGRNSVPLYVLYTGKSGEAPIVLPEILTPGIVIEALNKIEG